LLTTNRRSQINNCKQRLVAGDHAIFGAAAAEETHPNSMKAKIGWLILENVF
jgi:hypothetical protein